MSVTTKTDSMKIQTGAVMSLGSGGAGPVRATRPLKTFGWFVLVLSVAFGVPLFDLARFAAASELYSHILLIPIVAVYLGALKRGVLPRERPGWSPVVLAPLSIGVGLLFSYWWMRSRGWKPPESDHLSMTVFSWYCFLIAGMVWSLGTAALRALMFPVGLMIFMAPLPGFFTAWLETFLQYTSAEAASALFCLTGATVFREGLVFHLPGISIEVARECSGIHSSLMLLVTSLVAGHLFLRSPWTKTALALAVIPLGIARNGFRIFTLGMLCVHVSPKIIDSPLHHRGGPIFFVLSLVPFIALLCLLRRSERLREKLKPAPADLPETNARVSLDTPSDSQRAS